MSIRGRLGGLFIIFFLLVATSVAATDIALMHQQKDALVINLAGRQRMLLQSMTRYALEVERHPDRADLRAHLRAAATTFDTTLSALTEGGSALYTEDTTVQLPPAPNTEVRARLKQVHTLWNTFRPNLDVILNDRADSRAVSQAVTQVEILSPRLVTAMDEAVRAFERAAQAKVQHVTLLQGLFLLTAALLVMLGYLYTHRHIITPLQYLEGVAQDIGGGKLDTPVAPLGNDEIGHLARSLEEMRQQLYLAREHLETQIARRTRELEALYEVSREISSRLDVRHVLRSVVEKAHDLLDADVAVLCMLDDQGQVLRLEAMSGAADAVVMRESPRDKGLPATVLGQERALRCTLCESWCPILNRRYQTDHLAVSLRAGKRVIGALCVGSTHPHQFPPEALDLLTRLASSAAIALENARLYEQAERAAALEERQRIAADMHDSVAQALSYIALRVEQIAADVASGNDAPAVEALEQLRDIVDETLKTVRRIISDLHSAPPQPRSFQDLLRAMVEELRPESPCPVHLDIEPSERIYYPADVAEQVVRIAREALLNAIRHAQPSRILVRLQKVDDTCILEVEDNGCGFDVKNLSPNGDMHFGLKVMRARAARVGARLEIDSAPGKGTRVKVEVPM